MLFRSKLTPLLATLGLVACESRVFLVNAPAGSSLDVRYPESVLALEGATATVEPFVPGLPNTPNLPLRFSCLSWNGSECPPDLHIDEASGVVRWAPAVTRNDRREIVALQVNRGGAKRIVNLVFEIVADPLPDELTIEPAMATRASRLRCVARSGIASRYTVDWMLNGATVPRLSGVSELPSGTFQKGDLVACRTTSIVSGFPSQELTSEARLIANAIPTARASLAPLEPRNGTLLTCSATGSEDEDGDDLETQYRWWLGDLEQVASGSTLLLSGARPGTRVRCQSTVADALGSSVAIAETTVANTPPVVAAALSANSGLPGETLTCLDLGSADPDGEALTHAFRWFLNDTPIAGASSATLSLAPYLHGDRLSCELMATDPQGGQTAARSESAVVLNRPPSAHAAIVQASLSHGAPATCSASLSSDPDGDALSHQYFWLRNGTDTSNRIAGQTGANLPAGILVNEDVVRCGVVTSDGYGGTGEATSNAIVVGNEIPIVAATLSSANAFPTETLVCQTTGTIDPEGGSLTFSYRWFKGDAVIGGATTNSLALTPYRHGDRVSCEVTAMDPQGGQASQRSAEATVLNRPPVAMASLTPGTANRDSTFQCDASASRDDDEDPVTLTYEWIAGETIIAGQSGSSLAATEVDIGSSIRCRVTARDGFEGEAIATSNAVVVANRPPVATAALSNPTPFPNETLRCLSEGSHDPDEEMPTITFRWFKGIELLEGATDWSLPLTSFRHGDALSCEVAVTDTQGSQAFQRSGEAILQNRPPMATVSLTPSTAYRSTTFSCNVEASDDDGDALSLSYEWLVGTTVLESQAGSTLAASPIPVGSAVKCRATVRDGFGGEQVLTSSAVTVANRIPVAAAVIPESSTSRSQPVTCDSSQSSDGDNDPLQISYKWLRNGTTLGAVIEGQTNAILPAWVAQNGDTLRCAVAVSDGVGGVATALSGPLTVGNLLPEVSAAVSPLNGNSDTVFTCDTTGTHDDDQDVLTVSIEWIVDDVSVSTGSTLPAEHRRSNARIRCAVTADDAHGGVVTTTSPEVTITNRSPVASAQITTPHAYRNVPIVCDASASVDPDGDTLQFTYSWYRNGVEPDHIIQNQTTTVLSPGLVTAGDQVRCSVKVDDVHAATHKLISNPITVENRPPSVSAAVTPPGAAANSELTCSTTGSFDPDDDVLSFSYRWFKNGNTEAHLIADETEATLAGMHVTSGATFFCEATSSDGIAVVVRKSAGNLIGNQVPTAVSAITTTPVHVTAPVICSSAGSTDPDGDSLAVEYAWYANGNPIAGANTAQLDTGRFANGASLTCRVTVDDGKGGVASSISSPVSVVNRPPIAQATLTGTPAYRNSTLTCNGNASSDPDGDVLTKNYAWRKNGSLIIGATAATLPPGSTAANDVVACRVSVVDGHGGSHETWSNDTTIGNRAPSAVAQISTNPVYNSTPLTCSTSGSSDPDGDTLTYAFVWRNASGIIVDQTANTLTPSSFGVGSRITCSVTATDSVGASSTATSLEVTIPNRTPVAVASLVTGGSTTKADSILCSGDGSNDADGDTLNFAFAWLRNGSEVNGANAASLSLAPFDVNDSLACRLTVSDPWGGLSIATTSAVSIQNRTPVAVATVLAATSTTPYGEASPRNIINLWVDLKCDTTGSVEPDGEQLAFSYSWKNKGITVSGASGQTLPRARFKPNDEISCTASASDPWNATSTQASAAVKIPLAHDDFNGDGLPDILFQGVSTGTVPYLNGIWLLDSAIKYVTSLHAWNNETNSGTSGMASGWYVSGYGDMDGDTLPDLVMYNSTLRYPKIFFGGPVDGNGRMTWKGVKNYNSTLLPDTTWYARSAADFTGDGKLDLLFHSRTTTNLIVWEMDGHTRVAAHTLAKTAGSAWGMMGAGDANGDGKPDIFFHNRYSATPGAVVVWFMNGLEFTSSRVINDNVGTAWEIGGLRDLNRDGRVEIIWENCTSDYIRFWTLNEDGTYVGANTINRASNNAVLTPDCANWQMRSN